MGFLDALPPRYRVERGRRGVLAVAEGAAEELAATGFGPDEDGRSIPAALGSRSELHELDLPSGACLRRRFRHGGLLRWLLRSRYLDPGRPFRELALSRRLADAGVRTPEVVAARARRLPLGGFELDLVTRRVEGAWDLGELLASREELAPVDRRRLARSLGALVARLHEIGFLHSDLQPRNVLVRPGEGGEAELWLIDLDGSRFVDAMDDEERARNLARLYRAVRRRELHGLSTTRASDLRRFLAGYDGTGERWRAIWRAVETIHRRESLRHEAGWMLERLAGSETELADRAPGPIERAARGR